MLVGGMRAMDSNAGGSPHGVFTDRPGTLSNDFFVNLIDMSTQWSESSTEGVYEGRDRATGALQVDGDSGRSDLRLKLRAACGRGALRGRRRAGSVPGRFHRRLDQGDDPGPLRSRAVAAGPGANFRAPKPQAGGPCPTRGKTLEGRAPFRPAVFFCASTSDIGTPHAASCSAPGSRETISENVSATDRRLGGGLEEWKSGAPMRSGVERIAARESERHLLGFLLEQRDPIHRERPGAQRRGERFKSLLKGVPLVLIKLARQRHVEAELIQHEWIAPLAQQLLLARRVRPRLAANVLGRRTRRRLIGGGKTASDRDCCNALASIAPGRSRFAVSCQPRGRQRVHTEMVGRSTIMMAASRVQRLSATAPEMRPIAC